MAADDPRVGLVTVHFRNLDVTRKLVECVHASLHARIQLVIVNNSPHQADRLQALVGPPVRVLQTGDNLGYAGGLNLGLHLLLDEARTDWVVLANNDISFGPDLIAQMVSRADRHGIRSPILLYQDTNLVQNTGGRILSWLGGTRNLNKMRPLSKLRRYQPDFLSGAFMLMHRSVIQSVGDFDASYQSYYEDVDYCLRAKAQGHTIAIDWRAHAWHAHSASTRDRSDFKSYLIVRNQIRFARRWLSGPRRLLFITSGLCRGLLKALVGGQFSAFRSAVKAGFAEFPND